MKSQFPSHGAGFCEVHVPFWAGKIKNTTSRGPEPRMWCSDMCCLRVTVSTWYKELHIIQTTTLNAHMRETWKREKLIRTNEMKNTYIKCEYYTVQYSGYHTVDGRIPAPPGMYKTHVNNEIDYPTLNWCRISSINSSYSIMYPRRNPGFLTKDFLGLTGDGTPRYPIRQAWSSGLANVAVCVTPSTPKQLRPKAMGLVGLLWVVRLSPLGGSSQLVSG